MNRKYRKLALVSGLCLVGACVPEKRIVFSPDGSRALVRMADDRLFVLEGPDLKPRDLHLEARGMDWLPDGRRAVVTAVQRYKDWASLAAAISPQDHQRVTDCAARIVDRARAYAGPMDKFKCDDLLPDDNVETLAAILCLRDTVPADVRTKWGEQWRQLDLDSVDAMTLRVLVIDTAAAQGGVAASAAGPQSAPLLMDLGTPSVDPTGRLAAVLAARPHESLGGAEPAYALALFPIDPPGAMQIIDEHVGYQVVWRRDGRELAYFRYRGGPPAADGKDGDQRLGTLVTRPVAVDGAGHLAATQPAGAELAGVLFHSYAGLQYGEDASLLFAAMDLRLPATTAGTPERWTVFRWTPRYPSVVSEVLGQDAQRWFRPNGLAWLFSISPDGRRLLLAGGGDGAGPDDSVCVLDPATGDRAAISGLQTDGFETVENGRKTWHSGTLPVWRSADEIAAVVKPGSEIAPRRGELVLIRLAKDGEPASYRCLSRDWPDEWVKGWLQPNQPQSRPAATQSSPGPR